MSMVFFSVKDKDWSLLPYSKIHGISIEISLTERSAVGMAPPYFPLAIPIHHSPIRINEDEKID